MHRPRSRNQMCRRTAAGIVRVMVARPRWRVSLWLPAGCGSSDLGAQVRPRAINAGGAAWCALRSAVSIAGATSCGPRFSVSSAGAMWCGLCSAVVIGGAASCGPRSVVPAGQAPWSAPRSALASDAAWWVPCGSGSRRPWRRCEGCTIAAGGGGLGVRCRSGGHALARPRPWFRVALWMSPGPRRLRVGRLRRRRSGWLGLMHTPVPAGTRLWVVRLGRPSTTTVNVRRRCCRAIRLAPHLNWPQARIIGYQSVGRRWRHRGALRSPRPNRAAGRVVLRQAVGHQALQQLPVLHRGVDVRQQVAQLLQPALAVPVDHRLQLPAVAAQRPQPIPRAPQLGIQRRDQLADLARRLSLRLLDQFPLDALAQRRLRRARFYSFSCCACLSCCRRCFRRFRCSRFSCCSRCSPGPWCSG